ncbi:unnamed protein product [Victoria cruziana]
MMDMFRAVRINLPLLDAISQMPIYARFLKELCAKKRRCRKFPDIVMLSEEVSSIIKRRILEKMADPGAPIIPCIIGNIGVERAFLDLRASMNVLPSFFYNAFQLGGLKLTTMTIQLVNQTVKVPRRVLEDVLLKVEDFIFPADFVVSDMEGVDAEHQMPIILGRLFFAIANACINCCMSILEISFGDRKVRLKVFLVMMGPPGNRCISFTEIDANDVDEAAHEVSMAIFTDCIADQA